MTLPSDPMKEARDAMKAAQHYDLMKEMQEAMKAAQYHDPMKEMREAMKAAQYHDPMKEMREAMKAAQYHDPMKEMREAIKAAQYHDPMKEMREAMKAAQYHDPMKEMREAMKALQYHDPIKEMREAMKALQFQDPMKEMWNAIKVLQIHDPMKEMREAMKALHIDRLAEAMSPRAWPLAYENLDADITIRDDNTIAIGSTTLTRSEIQSLVDQIANKAFAQSTGQLEKAVSAIVAEIASLRNPTLEKLLTWLIFPIILAAMFAIINPVADFYIKEALSANERQMKKNIRKHVLASVDDSTQLDSYRFVSTKTLDVHLNPSAQSPVLGQLHFGQSLLLLEKDRAWSLVAWCDDDGRVALQGWVFSRYLNKFR